MMAQDEYEPSVPPPSADSAADHQPQPSETGVSVDPALKAAWLAYKDYEARDRDRVEQMFRAYVAKHPDSPFTPEIHYRIGSMYSNNANRRIGETIDLHKRDEAFAAALQGYGDLYSIEADAARSHLVARPAQPLEDRLSYYNWLIAKETDFPPDAVFPIRSIAEHVTYGSGPRLSDASIDRRIDEFRRYLGPKLRNVEDGIIRLAKSNEELAEIAKRYPDRRLGRLAEVHLNRQPTKPLK